MGGPPLGFFGAAAGGITSSFGPASLTWIRSGVGGWEPVAKVAKVSGKVVSGHFRSVVAQVDGKW